MKIISIIIVTYNSESCLYECLRSLQLHNDLKKDDIEIVVVDNSVYTSIELREIVKLFPNVHLIRNNINKGFGQGNNIGADASSGEILLFLNPDTKFIEPVFKEVVNSFRGDLNIGTIGCQLIDESGRQNNTYGYFPEKFNAFIFFLHKVLYHSFKYIPRTFIYPWGANLFIRKSDFYAAGKFDESFFLCHEEPDLCKRILPKKTKILKRRIMHYGEQSVKGEDKKYDEWMKSLKLYCNKYRYDFQKILKKWKMFYFIVFIMRKISFKNTEEIKKCLNKINQVMDSS